MADGEQDQSTLKVIEYNEDEINKIFDHIDIDGDDHICASELQKFAQLKGNNPTMDEVKEFMEKTENGEVDQRYTREEFKEVAMVFMSTLSDPAIEIDNALAEFDKEEGGDGKLNINNLRTHLCSKGQDPMSETDFGELMTACGCDVENDEYVERAILKAVLSDPIDFSS